MTTIATDGKSMAGDGLAVDHCDIMVDGARRKVHRLSDGRIAGACGSSFDVSSWREWLEAGKQGDCPIVDDRFAGLILNTDGSILWVDHKGRELKVPAPAAVGSGQDLAYGAMAVGATPRRAVEVAITRDIHSGGQIIEEVLECPS